MESRRFLRARCLQHEPRRSRTVSINSVATATHVTISSREDRVKIDSGGGNDENIAQTNHQEGTDGWFGMGINPLLRSGGPDNITPAKGNVSGHPDTQTARVISQTSDTKFNQVLRPLTRKER